MIFLSVLRSVPLREFKLNYAMKSLRVIAVALVISALLPAAQVRAATTVRPGDLVKGSDPTVYYITNDEKRLAFPDETTFRSWYSDFGQVKLASDSDIAAFPFVGAVQLRPGVEMVKTSSSHKVYAVANGGILRWIPNASIASMIYGSHWTRKIAVISDAAFADYKIGAAITGPGQYWWKAERDASLTIDDAHPARLPVVTTADVAGPFGPTITVKAVIVNGTDGRFNANEHDTRLFIQNMLVKSGIPTFIAPGDYTIYWTAIPGYVASAGRDCNPASDDPHAAYIHLGADDVNKTCVVTFTYNPTAAQLPTITVHVDVINDDHTDNSGALPDDFAKSIATQSPGETGIDKAMNDVAYTVTPGQYKINIFAGNIRNYLQSGWSGDCNADGTVTVDLGDHKTCTITEDDRPKNDTNYPTMGNLVLHAAVKGGSLTSNDIPLFIEGGKVASDQLNFVDPRDYTVYYGYVPGYAASAWSGDCTPSSSTANAGLVHVNVNDIRTCTVTFTKL